MLQKSIYSESGRITRVYKANFCSKCKHHISFFNREIVYQRFNLFNELVVVSIDKSCLHCELFQKNIGYGHLKSAALLLTEGLLFRLPGKILKIIRNVR